MKLWGDLETWGTLNCEAVHMLLFLRGEEERGRQEREIVKLGFQYFILFSKKSSNILFISN